VRRCTRRSRRGWCPRAEQPAGGAEAASGEKKDNVVDADYEIVDEDKKKNYTL